MFYYDSLIFEVNLNDLSQMIDTLYVLRFAQWVKFTILKVFFLMFFSWYTIALPEKLFNDSYSTVIESSEGELLSAHIAADGQWRFPENSEVPYKMEKCIIEFEDKNFYYHFGVSFKGIVRALKQNFSNKRVVSGGSTITMQVIRMMRKNPPRTYREKIVEMILATRLEFGYSKKEILAFYTSHAPFGNNVVGLDAASWRYFGRKSSQLSWAESATLAVLPNAPGLIYPGKNHSSLLAKRNRLLKRLFEAGQMNQLEYALAISEPIPDAPLRLPQLAPHLMQEYLLKHPEGVKIRSTLQWKEQKMVMQVLNQHAQVLRDNRIMNGAVLVSEIETGKVIAYVGNTELEDAEYSGAVNCIKAARSSGSVLKPILYAKSIQEGLITPTLLLSDLPSKFGSYSPTNFTGQFEGVVPANRALSRSLNIPMVHLLQNYGLHKFHHDLKTNGFSTVNRSANHYGLSLILGGAEITMWDLNQTYLALAQQLQNIKTTELSVDSEAENYGLQSILFSKSAIYETFEALLEVNRPDEDNNWKAFEASERIAWKTGTSFGFRDGWAVGVSGKYVVTVWVGNADGEGRPGLTGVKAAAPIMFDIFRHLPKGKWFKKPESEYQKMKICSKSGHKAGNFCTETSLDFLPKSCANVPVCPYHQMVHLNSSGDARVTSECAEPDQMIHKKWFVLPPMVEQFYRFNHPEYIVLPNLAPDCLTSVQDNAIGLIYPKPNAKIVLAKELNGNRGSTLFEATHRNPTLKVYWHIDKEFIGTTTGVHQLTVQPEIGKHTLTLVDENGISLSEKFVVLK